MDSTAQTHHVSPQDHQGFPSSVAFHLSRPDHCVKCSQFYLRTPKEKVVNCGCWVCESWSPSELEIANIHYPLCTRPLGSNWRCFITGHVCGKPYIPTLKDGKGAGRWLWGLVFAEFRLPEPMGVAIGTCNSSAWGGTQEDDCSGSRAPEAQGDPSSVEDPCLKEQSGVFPL